jgi:hypothetical protein
MATYTIVSQEGVERYGGEQGDSVDLALHPDEALAVVAAGWLEPEQPKKKEAK